MAKKRNSPPRHPNAHRHRSGNESYGSLSDMNKFFKKNRIPDAVPEPEVAASPPIKGNPDTPPIFAESADGKIKCAAPMGIPAEKTSGFGVRSDPFLGRPAMHTGLDLRAGTGEALYATLAGKVKTAGWAGGYGRMVEIDNGNGLSTRFGHASEVNVKVGDEVKPGDKVAEVGSTGRSTGPHPHYETLKNGEALDPQSKQVPEFACVVDAMNKSKVPGADTMVFKGDDSGDRRVDNVKNNTPAPEGGVKEAIYRMTSSVLGRAKPF